MAVKRVSTDEKLAKIINFLKSSNEFYSIKELEKKLSKECGISPMILPDLLKKLLDDNLIKSEKCGASNVYWCFGYQSHHFYSCETEKAILAIASFEEENKKKREHLKKILSNTKRTPERDELLDKYNALKEKVAEINEHKKQRQDYSYDEFKRLQNEIEEMKVAANKKTDNIFVLQGFVTNKFGISKREFNGNFGISDEFDYIN